MSIESDNEDLKAQEISSMVSIECGTEGRTFSDHYANPIKVFVNDQCIYDSIQVPPKITNLDELIEDLHKAIKAIDEFRSLHR